MAGETYHDEAEIREVVRKFEECEYALTEFTHARHVTVACWYLCTSKIATEGQSSSVPVKALERMRTGLRRFIAHHGKQGYHETITRFWMELLENFLNSFVSGTAMVVKVNRALECYGSKDALYAYYTRERVMSEIAKREWVEPDLRAIGGVGSGSNLGEEFKQIVERLVRD